MRRKRTPEEKSMGVVTDDLTIKETSNKDFVWCSSFNCPMFSKCLRRANSDLLPYEVIHNEMKLYLKDGGKCEFYMIDE